jgi:dihydroneopterin aldolase
MDTVFVEGLTVYAYHGASDEEREIGRQYRVDVWIGYDASEAAASDSLDCAIDYGRVCTLAATVLREAGRRLVEAVAYDLADRLLAEFPASQHVRVKLTKLQPPVGLVASGAGVEISRSRSGA